ncbi:MAG TPA: HPF/RaiA family ribosome-associated protein [Phycisphaerae bacterium]|nr:HPF/RaiA family ribosome-associated protein [Phycisphaerae bacterium]
MQIQVRTDNHIQGSEALTRHVETEVTQSLHRFGRQITRVEVHLTDTNSHKSGDADKRCVVEARLAGLQPIAVNDNAPTVHQAVSGAIGKIERLLDHTLGRLAHPKGRAPTNGTLAI